jgi:branched-chain amino acid aminotransferase
MDEIVYLNGRLIPRSEAMVSIMDYGFLYGYGLFETMRAYSGHVFRLDSHLKRLASSAECLKIFIDTSVLRSSVIETILANRLKEARVRLTVSIGEGSPVPDLHSCHQPTIGIFATAYIQPKPEIYDQGYRIIVSSTWRNSRSFLPQMKTANYLESLLAREEALSNGADDALLLNEKDYVTETSTSNIFIYANNTLKTPRLGNGLLPGITRSVVLELAVQHGIEILETDIHLEELLDADEVFLTNSIMEIMPVTAVNGKMIAAGKPGLITRNLTNFYKDIVNKETQSSVEGSSQA